MRDTFEKECGFFMRKIWDLVVVIEARRKGFYFTFTDGEATSDNSVRDQKQYQTSVPETRCVPQNCVEDGIIQCADGRNQRLLDELIEKFPRLTIGMNYRVVVKDPNYESNTRVSRSLRRAGKRTFAQMQESRVCASGCVQRGEGSAESIARGEQWPTIKKDADGNVVGMELPWGRILDKWAGVSVGHVMHSVPLPPADSYKVERIVELHILAASLFLDFTRAKDVLELLR